MEAVDAVDAAADAGDDPVLDEAGQRDRGVGADRGQAGEELRGSDVAFAPRPCPFLPLLRKSSFIRLAAPIRFSLRQMPVFRIRPLREKPI